MCQRQGSAGCFLIKFYATRKRNAHCNATTATLVLNVKIMHMRKRWSACLQDDHSDLQRKHGALQDSLSAARRDADAARSERDKDAQQTATTLAEMRHDLVQAQGEAKQALARAAAELCSAQAEVRDLLSRVALLQRHLQDEVATREVAEADVTASRMSLAEAKHQVQLAEGRYDGVKEQSAQLRVSPPHVVPRLIAPDSLLLMKDRP